MKYNSEKIGNYAISWATQPSISLKSVISELPADFSERYLKLISTSSRDDLQTRCIATLLNLDYWSKYRNDSISDLTIGGMSFEMFFEVYNELNPQQTRTPQFDSSYGFKIDGKGPGISDLIWNPVLFNTDGLTTGYWLAAYWNGTVGVQPFHAKSSDHGQMHANQLFDVGSPGHGLRPVTRLKRIGEITLTNRGDLWEVSE